MTRLSGRRGPGAPPFPIILLLVSAAVVAAWPAPLQAANDAQCREYAQRSLEAKKKNIFWKCGFRGPRWEATYQENYGWCRTASFGQTVSDLIDRDYMLRKARLYVENNTEIPIVVFVKPYNRSQWGGGSGSRIAPLRARTLVAIMPPGVNEVIITPLALQNQLKPVKLSFRTNNEGARTCRKVQRLIVTNQTFGKTVIVGPGRPQPPPGRRTRRQCNIEFHSASGRGERACLISLPKGGTDTYIVLTVDRAKERAQLNQFLGSYAKGGGQMGCSTPQGALATACKRCRGHPRC